MAHRRKRAVLLCSSRRTHDCRGFRGAQHPLIPKVAPSARYIYHHHLTVHPEVCSTVARHTTASWSWQGDPTECVRRGASFPTATIYNPRDRKWRVGSQSTRPPCRRQPCCPFPPPLQARRYVFAFPIFSRGRDGGRCETNSLVHGPFGLTLVYKYGHFTRPMRRPRRTPLSLYTFLSQPRVLLPLAIVNGGGGHKQGSSSRFFERWLPSIFEG